MLKEFKDFINRGKVMDMAVGVIIGGAFGKIVASLVNDIIMPIVGLILGNTNFSELFFVFGDTKYESLKAAEEAGAAIFKYGSFIQSIIDFLIIAFCIFMMVKFFNRFKKKEEPAPVTTKICKYCKMEIPKDAVKCPHCTGDLSNE